MQQESYKYWAFISYSHRDQAWAEWLHKALETYRVPRRLVGRETAAGPVPRRLFPVFRDLEELPSSPNLSGAIDQALLQSRYLIVIASPYAAVSKWVDQEIARFRAMGRGDRILCLIVDGEPHADLQPGKGFLECFPPSLRTKDGIEPIAADVRPGKDGKPAARLKLIAGLLGTGLDELRRRERRRQLLRNLSWTAFSCASASVLVGLWLMQQHEKQQALAQQALHTHIETVYEQGRQELIAHNQARAAVYLNEAYRLGVDTPALHFLLARAMRIVDAEKLAFQTGAAVSAVRFSPNSRMLVTTGSDGVAKVWNTVTAKKIFEFSVQDSGSSSLPRFSRDSRLIFVFIAPDSADHGMLNVWDVETGRPLASLQNPRNTEHTFNPFDRGSHRVGHVAPDHAAEIIDLQSGQVLKRLPGEFSVAGFSRDGKHFLAGSENGEVTVWDDQASRKMRTLRGLSSHVVALDDTEDGSLIAAAARDGAIRVWRTADGGQQVVAGHPSPNPSLIFNVDGSRLLTKASDGARVWNTGNGQLVYVQQFAGAATNKFDISSAGRWVMSSSSSRLAVQDVQSGVELFTLDGHRGMPEARDISEDDQLLATGGPDGRVVLWNMPGIPDFEFHHEVDPVRWAVETKPPGVAAVFSHKGDLIASGAGDGDLKFWDASTHRLVRSIKADARSVNTLEFSADDTQVVTGGHVDGVKIWDVASGRLLNTLDCGGKRILTVALSKDGHTVAAAILGGITRLWNADTGEIIETFERDEARAGRFSPDGRFFAVGVHQAIKLLDIARRRELWSAPLAESTNETKEDIAAIDFSADGEQLLASGYGQAAVLLDSRNGRVLGRVRDPSARRFNSARLDHSGRNAVFTDQNGGVFLWSPAKGISRNLRGHAGEVSAAEFSPDDQFVLTSGADATAKLWDVWSGELLDTVAEHGSPMPDAPYRSMAFSPDGRWMLTGSTDGVIREWELRVEPRSSQQIENILHCRVPWRLEGETLIPSTPGLDACW
ncbi:toll/interleukin-1 receptor domain-containing protein [Nevskia soli]|uniref:toll/interleukin-1 receptor domain-containing protein n=1 Tax=Nevskia soli TaxID=418856 RepID=UPI0004A73BEA|nr:TIR domain-containing protein [Nevskia soli]